MIFKAVPYGQLQRAPWGCGIAWKNWHERTVVYAPLGLNRLMGWARQFLIRMKYWPVKDAVAGAYVKGYHAGAAYAYKAMQTGDPGFRVIELGPDDAVRPDPGALT